MEYFWAWRSSLTTVIFLGADQLDMDRVTGCGGTINTPSKDSYWMLGYPYASGIRKYSVHEGCTWRINTGLPTKLSGYGTWSMEPATFIYIYDEYKLVKKTSTDFGTLQLHSGDNYITFKSGGSSTDRNYGFALTISGNYSIRTWLF